MVEPVTPLNIAPVASFAEYTEHCNSLNVEVGDAGHHSLLKSWANCITGLHQQFNNVQEVREALRRFSIAHGFKCKFKHNDATIK